MTATTINDQLSAERARKSAAFSTMSQRDLASIANSSSTAGRFTWLEISVAADVLAARAEANRLRALNNRPATVPVHEWRFTDGVVAGCGTVAEFNHWTAEGTLDGVQLGGIIGFEPASEDARRAAAWARLAA